MSPIQLTLYSRSYCHLCEQMLEALQLVREQHPFLLEVIDVDADPALVAQYDELVPVLTGSGNGASARELCHYFLDEKKVRDFLISCQNEK